MSQRVTITSPIVTTKEGTSSRTGKGYKMREQTAYLHLPGVDFPQVFTLTLGDAQPPYQPGEYTVEAPLRVGDFGRLEVARDLRLVPFVKPVAKVG